MFVSTTKFLSIAILSRKMIAPWRSIGSRSLRGNL